MRVQECLIAVGGWQYNKFNVTLAYSGMKSPFGTLWELDQVETRVLCLVGADLVAVIFSSD